MRVLHLLASPVFSGPSENVALLAAAQRALGHEVTVAVDRKRPGLSAEEPIVPRLKALDLLDEFGLELSVKSSPFAMTSDALKLRKLDVDVVHSHFSHDHLVARFGRPSRALLVRSIHAPRSLRRWLPFAHGYTVPTAHDAARFPAEKVRVLEPLLGEEFRQPEDRAALRQELKLSGSPLIGMVSTFQPSRRHTEGIAAFAQLRAQQKDARFILVGDGELEPNLRAQVNQLGLDGAVTFAGYQQGAQFVRWLQALDEVWILGLGNDWSGRAAAQARACGVRVVAVNEGGLPAFADEIVANPVAHEVVRASQKATRANRESRTNAEIASAMMDFYAALRAKR